MSGRKTIAAFLVAGFVGFLSSYPVLAAGEYTISTIDAPAGSLTVACGIDMRGGVVGYYVNGSGTHGFLFTDGDFVTITFPGAPWTAAYGVNNQGQIVGGYGPNEFNGRHGFLRSGGRFSSIDYPGGSDTIARGVNNRGQIVGDYLAPDGTRHGFLLSGGNYQPIDLPNGGAGEASGINDAGQIVGVLGSGPAAKGFVASAGSYAAVEFPNTGYTEVWGVNDLGDIVGKIDSPKAPFRGFWRSGDTYNLIDLAGYPSSWDGRGINNLGQIVGSYTGNDGRTHGYLATPVALRAGPADTAGNARQVGMTGPQGPQGSQGPQGPAGPPGPANITPVRPGNSLASVRDAISRAAGQLLHSANQADYVQKAITDVNIALDDVNAALAYSNAHPDSSPASAPTMQPNFNAPPPPAPERNHFLYVALSSLHFAYDALARMPGGDLGGFRAKVNADIAATAADIVNGAGIYNARHAGPFDR